jgi:biotin carboxyl carrier protein
MLNQATPIAEPPTEPTPSRLLDRNTLLPDGTDESLQKLLQHLAERLQAEIFLGFSSHGAQRLQAFSTRPANYRDKAVSPLFYSALLESSRSNTCLFAMEQNATSGVLRNVKEQEQATLVLGIGAGKPGQRLGLVICVKEQSQLLQKDVYGTILTEVQAELPGWLEQWKTARSGQSLQRWTAYATFYRQRTGQWAIAASAILLLCLAIPVPYWPQRDCVVEPASRRFLASPIAGRVSDAQVRPGDVVEAGQLLARIDDETIRWDLASAEAEYQMATKRRDSALASRAGGELRLAQLEQERFRIQIDALTKQLGELEIRSPIAGVVVQGDWHRNQGAPVDRGGTLFEIAPLETMRIETQLTTEDLAQIPTGSPATVRVDAAQGSSWQGKLSRIDPRGQVIDSKVVFVAEMEVANRDTLLRPGMKGSVRLSAGSRTIGWLLFHRPYVWLMKKLAW